MKKSDDMRKIGELHLWELGSLKELHRAQRTVNRAINRFEKKFVDELDDAREMFSWRDAITCTLGVADAVQSMIRYRNLGRYVNFGSGLLNGLRWHRARRKAHKQHCK